MKIITSSRVPMRKNLALKVLLLLGPILAFQVFVPEKWALHCRATQWTGIPCPSCGTTRCLQLLLEGNLSAAWQMNPLMCCTAILFGSVLIYSLSSSLLHWPAWRVVLNRKNERRAALLLVAAAVLGNWAYLIITS
jgi:hypothetical protein